MKWQHWSECA